jgi:hypothetical protein
VDTVNGAIQGHELFHPELGYIDAKEDAYLKDLHQRLYYYCRELRAIKRRSESLNERLQNEINLVRIQLILLHLLH